MTIPGLHQKVLRAELARRVAANANYSLRSFAKALAMDPSLLSKVMNGKRPLTQRSATLIATRLGLPPKDRALFLESVADAQRPRAQAEGEDDAAAPVREAPGLLDEELFRVIGDWYHVAIVMLCTTKDFEPSPRYVARRLGISQAEAALAIERLVELGFLERAAGRLVPSQTKFTTRDKAVTTPALRQFQRQIMEKAIVSLENTDLVARSMTGMTMAIDPEKLPVAKAMISEFMTSLSQFLEASERTRVYQLNVQLFPLEKLN